MLITCKCTPLCKKLDCNTKNEPPYFVTTLHSALNIFLQQSLSSLPNLSIDSLNRLSCRYEQLQLIVINEISFVGARMLNVIDNRLRSIINIQNKFFNGVDVIMTSDLYQTPFMKDSWIFQNIKGNVNALAPNF